MAALLVCCLHHLECSFSALLRPRPVFIDRGQHPHMPLSLPGLHSEEKPPAAYAARMKPLEQEVQVLRAGQQERKAVLDLGRVDTVFQVGDQVWLRIRELLDVAKIGKLRPQGVTRGVPLQGGRPGGQPEYLHPETPVLIPV